MTQLHIAAKQYETNKDLMNNTSGLPIRSIVVPSFMVTPVTEAPKSRSNWTLSACPFNAAIWRAVTPPSAGLSMTSWRALEESKWSKKEWKQKSGYKKNKKQIILIYLSSNADIDSLFFDFLDNISQKSGLLGI